MDYNRYTAVLTLKEGKGPSGLLERKNDEDCTLELSARGARMTASGEISKPLRFEQ